MPLSAVDTNVLAYAFGLAQSEGDRRKIAIAEALLRGISAEEPFVMPSQVCLEFHHLLVRKGALDAADAVRIVRAYMAGAVVIASDDKVLESAFDLASQHNFQTYDSVIFASAARAGCDVLYSEDMQDGFEWEGVRIVNPFA